MSGLNITVGFLMPIFFAFCLNEVGGTRLKKFVQTASYLPHFISWVVAGTMVTTVLGTDGVINDLLLALGVSQTRIQFLQKGEWYWTIITIVNIWKELGWSAIIYISAIAGVDQELYQAGAVDGLGRFGKVWHITIPSIMPTVVVLFILGIGNILNAGFEQQLLIGTPSTRKVYEVIDTYVYRGLLELNDIGRSTAAGFLQSVLGFICIFIANTVVTKIDKDSALF